MFQWFRLADSDKRITRDRENEIVDSFHHSLILGLPVQIIFPRRFGEDELHPD